MSVEVYRDQAVEFLRKQLIGPAESVEETVAGKPFWRYFSGMLFPADVDIQSLGESDEPDADTDSGETTFADPSLGMAYATAPSSMGISFYFSGTSELSVEVWGARYQNCSAPKAGDGDGEGSVRESGGSGPQRSDNWKRFSYAEVDSPATVKIKVPHEEKRTIVTSEVFDGKAQISALFRPKESGYLVTVTLVNMQQSEGSRYDVDQIERMLFQCGFRVKLSDGEIGSYPTVVRKSKHPEDEELALIYKKRATKGIGHGCAAKWSDRPTGGVLSEIEADPLPVTEVKGLTNDIDLPDEASEVLSVQWLANPQTDKEKLRAGLNAFLDAYRGWMNGQEDIKGLMEAGEKEPADRITERQERALARMREGAKLLLDEPEAMRAFKIAQLAMLMQFLWARRRGQKPADLGHGKIERLDVWAESHSEAPRWRPFQLGFQLLVLPSLFDADHEDRETLDLLWFPTGGGKTEAYLALAAFEMVLRRHRYFDAGAGTSIIMRYTLRLLTAQQFERCATLISALEFLRKDDESLGLGDTPFRLGLWVGGDTSPNRLAGGSEENPGAVELLERLLNAKTPENPFHLNACPACGTRIVPRSQSKTAAYGLDVTPAHFRMFCPDERCVLHEEIPVSVVDDDLFINPPTFIIGTIDKFARMAWDSRSRVFFGLNEGSGDRHPPSLIIQDELHLITGPLGTIAGTYEAAIDTLIRDRSIVPKYLAATATIQRASEQAKSLYARKAFVFPPAGLECDDSFFTKEDEKAPGRTYLGAMGHGLYSALTALVQVSATAAACPMGIDEEATLPGSGIPARDTYWTQVVYHNSRQELGKTTTMLRDDVLTRLELLQPELELRRPFHSIQELSANLKGSEISDTLERLQVSLPDRSTIDALACTNMISVGVDIGRLGLMIIKSQPKSTAEYIQASSRVGRNVKFPPGIVIALYAANRPRDRSHYEDFQSYHSSLYRAVEPVTVTPFSPQALERTLHAALIIPISLYLNWDSSGARSFDPDDPDISRLVARLKDRIAAAARDTEERDYVLGRLGELVDEWEVLARDDPDLVTYSTGAHHKLLCHFPSNDPRNSNAHWPTLNSMRHVDGESELNLDVGGRE